MGRARRDHSGDDEHEQEREDTPPPMELRYVYTRAHAELQWRVPNGAWQVVRSVPIENADEGETIEGEAEDVSNQRQLPAVEEDKES